jgi:hypothetical protein
MLAAGGTTMYEGEATRKQRPVRRERVVLADMRGEPETEDEQRNEDERDNEMAAEAAADDIAMGD